MAAPPAVAVELIDAWREAGPAMWFTRDAGFDAMLTERFGAVWREAATGAFCDWRATAEGALALVLLTDQIPRNLHRGSALAYATDPLARSTADAALSRGFDRQTAADLRPFLYMPYKHAESAVAQARAVALFARFTAETGGPDGWLRSALSHQEIIRRFGRFPHRNALLGRLATEAERRFLDGGGFAG